MCGVTCSQCVRDHDIVIGFAVGCLCWIYVATLDNTEFVVGVCLFALYDIIGVCVLCKRIRVVVGDHAVAVRDHTCLTAAEN
jgi:hypothetical protein